MRDWAWDIGSVEEASFCEVSSMVILRVGTTKRNTRNVGMDFL